MIDPFGLFYFIMTVKNTIKIKKGGKLIKLPPFFLTIYFSDNTQLIHNPCIYHMIHSTM